MSREFILARHIQDPISGCWNWTGGKAGPGYGSVPRSVHASRTAHRASYAWFCGPIPAGRYVLHRCDNRRCVNPEHLFLGTHLDNIKDMQAKDRHRGGSLPNESNPSCKFSDETIAAIRVARASGAKKAEIERTYGISETHYYRVVKGVSRVQA